MGNSYSVYHFGIYSLEGQVVSDRAVARAVGAHFSAYSLQPQRVFPDAVIEIAIPFEGGQDGTRLNALLSGLRKLRGVREVKENSRVVRG